ncbi:hypothetical protein TanjilG_32822 [Lupinus angustifolius]|uniref:Uncharacterized protein n=1 Tax=Lupinus angustifolius TaxID=3871 RepID=A0A1J7HVD1_LUPAN|nr:hypothetical protein TanjilG_01879 [Lupinus angustifolius]OIW22061.1 hypothetical protein TanjilG_32822 [Lupinus angustifolius]
MAKEVNQNVVVKKQVKNNLCNYKMNATVIPAPRKSVKRMMFEEIVQFFTRLFSTSEGNYKLENKTRCHRKIKSIYDSTELN